MEDSIFVKTFGASPKVKVLNFLLDNDMLDWCKADMAEQTGISRATLNKFFDELVKSEIIVKSRDIGRARLYKLNKKLTLVRKLIELDNSLIKQNIKPKVIANV